MMTPSRRPATTNLADAIWYGLSLEQRQTVVRFLAQLAVKQLLNRRQKEAS